MRTSLRRCGAHRRSWSGQAGLPSELVALYLERIASLEPTLNAYRVVLADGARPMLSRQRSGWQRATMPRCSCAGGDQGQRRLRGRVTTDGTAAYGEPATEDGHVVRGCAKRGATILGKTQPARAGDLRVHREPTWATPATPGYLADLRAAPARQWRATARVCCSIAHATDGGGLDSHPGRYNGLLGLKPQRTASRSRRIASTGTASRIGLREPNRDGHSALPRRDERRREGDFQAPPPLERPLVEAASTPPGKLRIACTTKTILPCPKRLRSWRRMRRRSSCSVPRA